MRRDSGMGIGHPPKGVNEITDEHSWPAGPILTKARRFFPQENARRRHRMSGSVQRLLKYCCELRFNFA